MKESFMFGVMIGALAGIAVYKYSKEAKQVVDKGEKIIKSEIQNCKKEIKSAMKK